MSEAALVRQCLKWLNSLPQVKAIKFRGTTYTEVGTPDIIGCASGKMFLVECKVGNNKPTTVQERSMQAWLASGAEVTVVRSQDELRSWICSWYSHINCSPMT